MPRLTGRVVAGRYSLTEPIGRGAMGVVWRARDSLLDRDVAIKEVFFKGAISDEDRENAYKRTMREARTAARLSHRGVVTIYDVAEEDGRPWIIMELVPSRSLEKILASDGPLSPRRACRIGQQLLAALAHAHEAGVLHRDVKPGNVLIAHEPDGERAVLTDFGIAQFAGDPRLTQTGMVMGSPGFTAPERIRGGTATPASDLWSLGATLFAAVEGHGPYEKRGGAITTMTAIINEDAPIAMAAGPLGPLIAALLHRNPRLRPPAGAAGRMFAGVLPLLPPDPLPAQRGPRLALKALPGPSGAGSTSPDGAPVPVAGTVPGTVPGALAAPEDASEEKIPEEQAGGEQADGQQATADGPASEAPDDPAEAGNGLPESAGAADTSQDEEAQADAGPADEEASADAAAADAPAAADAAPGDGSAPDETEHRADDPTAEQPGPPDASDVPEEAADEQDVPDEQGIPTVDAPTAEVLARSRTEAPEPPESPENAEAPDDADVPRDGDASGAADTEPAHEAAEDDAPAAEASDDLPSAEDEDSPAEAPADGGAPGKGSVPSFRLAAALTEEPPTMVADGPPAITATIAPPTAVLPAVSPAMKLPPLSRPAPVSRPPAGVPSSDDAPTKPQPARYLQAAGYPPPASLARRRGRRAVIAVAVLVILVVIGAAVALMTSHGLSTHGNTASAGTSASLAGTVKAIITG